MSNGFLNVTYNLSTENYPFISRLRNEFTGRVSTFNCVVYFVRKTHSCGIKWGTESPIQVRDKMLGMAIKLKACGAYKVQIENSVIFLEKLLGNNIYYCILIKILTDDLPILRAKTGIFQDDILSIIGISRQTYSAIETKKRRMSWNTFLSLKLFYGYNEKTTNFVEDISAFLSSLRKTLSLSERMKEEQNVASNS